MRMKLSKVKKKIQFFLSHNWNILKSTLKQEQMTLEHF